MSTQISEKSSKFEKKSTYFKISNWTSLIFRQWKNLFVTNFGEQFLLISYPCWSKKSALKVFFWIFAARRSLFFDPENELKIFWSNFDRQKICRFSQKVFFSNWAVIRSLFFVRAPQMGVYKLKCSFFKCRKWVFIRSQSSGRFVWDLITNPL